MDEKIKALVERLRHESDAAYGGNEFDIEVLEEAADALAAQEAEIAGLEKLVYVPGLWRCAKCNFCLTQMNMNAHTGNVTTRDQPGDKCPNCDGPLWRVTERKGGNDMIDVADKAILRANTAEAELSSLRAAAEKMAIILQRIDDEGKIDMLDLRQSLAAYRATKAEGDGDG